MHENEGTGIIKFLGWSLKDDIYGEGVQVGCHHGCEFWVNYEATEWNRRLCNVSVSLTIKDNFGQPLFSGATYFLNTDFASIPPVGTFICRFANMPLTPGLYKLHLWCSINGQFIDKIADAGSFEVMPNDVFGTGRLPSQTKHGNFILKDYIWTVKER